MTTTTRSHGRPQVRGSLVRDTAPFLGLTFAISWGLWALAVGLGGDIADPTVLALFAAGGCGPTLAAGALALLGRRTERHARLAAAPGWLPASLLVGVLPAVVAAAVAPLFGTPAVDASAATDLVAQLGGVLPLIATFLVTGPLAEEFGWRGHLQPRLRRSLSPAATAAVLGGFWAVWHAPLFLLVGTAQSGMGGLLSPAALLFFASMAPLSVGYWFVSERLRGGVPAAVLVHTAGNISLTALAVMQSIAGGVVFLVTAVVVAGVLLALPRS